MLFNNFHIRSCYDGYKGKTNAFDQYPDFIIYHFDNLRLFVHKGALPDDDFGVLL